ncbi:MAG TPA: SIMPL domain-containing protein [Candidatus Polarisedimenticolia bacterium]|nr:SIMPL domain-containing protein [Candidatus Polarisedimenticolia bacterium]
MRQSLIARLAVGIACGGFGSAAIAQGGGSRAGDSSPARPSGLAPLDHFAAEHYITIQGSVELRVAPEQVQVVFAVFTEAETAAACQGANAQKRTAVSEAWRAAGLLQGEPLADFIALLPVYRWRLEERAGEKVAVESVGAFLLQTNLHVTLPDETSALRAVELAMQQGVGDVLAFDYASPQLDALKAQAQELALAEAQRKASLLLPAIFGPESPRPINVHETTTVLPPRDQYRTFEKVYAPSIDVPYLGDHSIVRMPSHRPRNTWLDPDLGSADRKPATFPQGPEIAVRSEITLYYAAPDRPDSSGPLPALR